MRSAHTTGVIEGVFDLACRAMRWQVELGDKVGDGELR